MLIVFCNFLLFSMQRNVFIQYFKILFYFIFNKKIHCTIKYRSATKLNSNNCRKINILWHKGNCTYEVAFHHVAYESMLRLKQRPDFSTMSSCQLSTQYYKILLHQVNDRFNLLKQFKFSILKVILILYFAYFQIYNLDYKLTTKSLQNSIKRYRKKNLLKFQVIIKDVHIAIVLQCILKKHELSF